jgi:hypothetical protein
MRSTMGQLACNRLATILWLLFPYLSCPASLPCLLAQLAQAPRDQTARDLVWRDLGRTCPVLRCDNPSTVAIDPHLTPLPSCYCTLATALWPLRRSGPHTRACNETLLAHQGIFLLSALNCTACVVPQALSAPA